MKSDERVGVIPVPTGLVVFVDDQNARIGFGEDSIGKCHAHSTTANYEIIGREFLHVLVLLQLGRNRD